jgi:mono/diheme cytochrome c family protein
MTHGFFESQLRSVGSDNATRFLSPVLERVQTEVRQSRGVGMSINSEDATLFTELVDLDFSQLSRPDFAIWRFTGSIIPKMLRLRYDAFVRLYFAAVFILVSLSSFASLAAEPEARTAPQLYRRYCVSCHGNDGRAKTSKGKFSHARNLADAQWQAEVSDERIFNSIMNGRNVRGNMPAFADKLNDKEADALVNFVRGLKAPQQE